jgi:hypothetical protein
MFGIKRAIGAMRSRLREKASHVRDRLGGPRSLHQIPRVVIDELAVRLRARVADVRNRLANPSSPHPIPTRAEEVAWADIARGAGPRYRPFSNGPRPVIRWIKADGRDDEVTRAAIATATRLFGRDVDYCLCTVGLDPERVRRILAWARAPVEWWPVGPDDNPRLAALLAAAGASPAQFGYWWKWFPERVRPAGPEWILDGDMVVVGRPAWFDDWARGLDVCRISAEDSDRYPDSYGAYRHLVDSQVRMYSGLVSLPPGLNYMPQVEAVLRAQPLASPHDGRQDMSEQGVVAAAFQRLGARPFPLCEFPFARAFDQDLDFGRQGDRQMAWGYHFGWAFRRDNPHFERMVAQGTILSCPDPSLIERFAWLNGYGQWGVPGWSLDDACVGFILDTARQYVGQQVLEIGTSRGHMTAMLSALGCKVTTVDHIDRGAAQNLAGMGVSVVNADGRRYLASTRQRFDLLIIDVHGNSEADWRQWAPLLRRAVRRGGRIAIDNLRLAEIPEWRDETGVAWLVANLPRGLTVEAKIDALPGVVVLRNA